MKKILFLLSVFAVFANKAHSKEVWKYEVSAKKLDESRNNLSPKTGGSSYLFNQETINNLPQAQTTSLNQLLLRAPGVTQNSQGQFHIRGDHSNVQYRINDVMIPQGISGFGNGFDLHYIDSVNLLRGTLPAQYGYRTGGVVDIKTKNAKNEKSGRSEITVGENNTMGFNQQLSGLNGNLNYYLNATYLQNDRGIESPTAARNSIHNESAQDRIFGHFSYLLDEKKRLSFILANATNHFQIPNVAGKTAEYSLPSHSIASQDLNQKQREENRYAIVALQGVSDSEVDYQLSLYSNQNKNKFRSDYVGDLIYSGIASDTDRSSFNNGVQGDFSYNLNDKNTLRSGFFANSERVESDKNSFAFLDGTSDVVRIEDNSKQNTELYGVYLQDEFRPTTDLKLNFGARFDYFNGNVSE